MRLAWCGGFGLDDPEVLVTAAAAAGLGLGDALDVADDVSHDGPMDATAERLLAAGRIACPPSWPTAACSRASCGWREPRRRRAPTRARLGASRPKPSTTLKGV